MGLSFQFECAVCGLQGGALERYAGGRWHASLIATTKFFMHHIETCDTSSFDVVRRG